MGCHIGTYLYRQDKGSIANDTLIANPFKIDFFFHNRDPLFLQEICKIQSTLLYSSNKFELGMNLGVLAIIGRHFEVMLGKRALFNMFLVNSFVTTLCFLPGVLKNKLINMNSNYNKYSSTFSLCLCSTYYFLNFVGLTSIKIACLALYIYLIYKDSDISLW